MNGFGKFTFSNGDQYIGSFYDDELTGEAIYIRNSSDGAIIKGNFENG
jgi:hypothetical protein